MTAEELSSRQAIVDTIVKLFVATDERDWATVEECFADAVHFDMTSLAGGEPLTLIPPEIAAAWSEGLAPIESVHHQAGNFQVQLLGDEATAFCYAIALHYRKVASGRNVRRFVGSYDLHLIRDPSSRWCIDLFRFNVKFVDGNVELHTEQAAG